MTARRSPSSILALFGTATLVAGTIGSIEAGCLTAPDVCTILVSRNTPGGTLGFLAAPVDVRGASSVVFRIASSSATETSSVNWLAIPRNGGSATLTNTGSLRQSPSGLNVQKGRATLVGGTVTVTAKAFGANARIFVMAATFGGTPGKLSAPVASVNAAAGSFVINSNSGTDTSTVDWIVVDEPLRFSPSGPPMAQARGTLVAGTNTFTKMNPLDEVQSVIANYTNTTNPGNLSAPVASRTGGSVVLLSSDNTDVGIVELAAF